MQTNDIVSHLSSLTNWSMQHIRDIFEAGSDDQCLKAVVDTFSENVVATINGSPITRENIKQLVLSMRKGSQGLRVQWQQAVEVPKDPATNREGSFGGMYIIRGIQRVIPGSNKPVEYERHKTVTVKIESQSDYHMKDSRKIVNLAFVASDIRVHRQATL